MTYLKSNDNRIFGGSNNDEIVLILDTNVESRWSITLFLRIDANSVSKIDIFVESSWSCVLFSIIVIALVLRLDTNIESILFLLILMGYIFD